MGLGDFFKGVDDFFFGEKRRADEDWERTWGHKIGKPWEKVETYGEQRIREEREKSEHEMREFIENNERLIQEGERQHLARIQELKRAFEASGRKENYAETSEVETLLNLTEKKIIQQCHRPKCLGCKLGWICPKFHFE